MSKERELSVFLASSGELRIERETIKKLIENDYQSVYIKFKIEMWEDMSKSFTKNGIQKQTINPVLQESDIVILMFHSKVGEFTKEEFEIALKNLKENTHKTKYLFLYYSDKNSETYKIDNNNIKEVTQNLEVISLVNMCKEDSQVPIKFKSIDCLKNSIDEELRKIEKIELYGNKETAIENREDTIETKEKDILNNPKICIYTASPLNNKIEYKLPNIFKLFKTYKLEITHKVLNENELLNFRDFDFNLIFSNINKEKIIIEDEYFIQKSISLGQLEDMIDTKNTILFLNNVIENSQFIIKKRIPKEIVNFITTNFKTQRGHASIHPLKTELPYDIDITKLNGFVGRKEDIESIIRKILTIRDEHKILNIKGAGGLGKTTLISKVAVEIAKRGKYKDGIEFVRCEYIKDYEGFENKITFAFNMSNASNFKDQLKSLYDDEDRLIILDNIETLLHLEDTKEIKELIHYISNYATIVTTSREILRETGFEEIYPLKEFSTDEAEELFTNIYKMKKYDKKQFRIEILENILSNNPLAITLVANNLSKGKNTEQIKKELEDNFISMTTKDLEDIFDRDSDNNIERLESLFSSINYSYIQLSQKEKLAIEILSLFPNGIHFENFKMFYNQKPNDKNKEKRKEKLQEISSIKSNSFSEKHLKSLEDKSLIINNNQHISLQSIIGRFAHYKFNIKNKTDKIEFYQKAYLYNYYLLNLLIDKDTSNIARAVIFDKNKDNFLKCLGYMKYLDLDIKKFYFIFNLRSEFNLSSPNKKIFQKLEMLKDVTSKEKLKRDFFDLCILNLKYFYYSFDDVYETICKKYPIDKLINNYHKYEEIELLNANTLLSIYSMEGFPLEKIRLHLSKGKITETIFRIGEYNIFKHFLKNNIYTFSSITFELNLNCSNLCINKLKKYISSLYKTQIIEKIQATYVLIKADRSEVKLKNIKKLVVTNPFTDGLKTLILAIKDNENCSQRYEDAIRKLFHIKYYHVEAIYLYSKYLKEINSIDYNKWFNIGKKLSIKHHYRFLQHQFKCLDSEIYIDYNEKDYPLLEKLDFSKIIKEYNLKGFEND